MKTLLINSTKLSDNTITAHSRNAIILSKELGIKLISTKEEIEALNVNNYKKFIVSGSGFYPETAAIEKEIRKNENATLIWLNNEYSTSPNSEYARLMKDIESFSISNIKTKYNGLITNLNTLIYNTPNPVINKKYDCIYYGTYRPGRRLYFQKYLQDNFIYLSSSAKNIKKYKFLAGTDAIWCDKLNWEKGKESLNLFKYSLYIEDEHTHKNYNYLANRFYECLMCNVVQFFDINCKNTIEQSGIEFDNYFYVSNLEELKEKIKNDNFEKSLEFQKKWNEQAKKERENVIKVIKEILV